MTTTHKARVLNYTTKVPVGKTVREIIKILSQYGSTRQQVEYAGPEIVALTFDITREGRSLTFRLPVNVDAVHVQLREQFGGQYSTRAHAVDVAWRILKDWVEAQMALVALRMVKTEEVFLPYMLDQDNLTLFQAMEHRWAMLPPGSIEA